MIFATPLFLACALLGAENTPSPQDFLKNGVTAHRGFSSAHPENTLAAFQAAIDLGADWVELDIFKSADGKLVVCHDASTKRIADKELVISESSYESIAKLDMAYAFRKQHRLSLEECPKMHAPLLEEVLALILRQAKTRLSIQPKMPVVPEAIALIKKMKAEAWVGFNEGSLEIVREVKKLAPAIPVFWDRPATLDLEKDLKIAQDLGFEAMVLHYRGITPERVKTIQAVGIEVGAWTVNDPEKMSALLKQGVFRIYTDYPDLLLNLKR